MTAPRSAQVQPVFCEITAVPGRGQYIEIGILLSIFRLMDKFQGRLLNAGYFVPVVYRAFFRPPAEGVDHSQFTEAPLVMVVPLCLTALVSVTLGLFPQLFASLVDAFAGF